MSTAVGDEIRVAPLQSAGRPRRVGGAVVALIVVGTAIAVTGLKSKETLLDSLTSAMDQAVTLVILALVVVLFAVGTWLRWQARRSARSIHHAAERFDDIGRNARREVGAGTTDAVLEEMEGAVANAGAWTVLGRPWTEFRASLLRRDGAWYKLQESRQAFREDVVESGVTAEFRALQVTIPYSFTRELASFKVGLGMLGTFIGISIGLGQLAGPAGSERIIDEIGGVISGLASAFWTSIFGLIASSITTWRNHKAESTLDFALEHFCRELDARVGLASSELLLEEQSRESERHGKELVRMREAQEQANTYLSTLANDLSESLGPLLERVATAVRDQVTSVAQPVVEKFESLAGSLDSVVERVESFGATLGNQMAGAAKILEAGVARAGEQLNVSLDTAIGRATTGLHEMGDRTLEAMTNVGKQMEVVVTSVSDTVDESVYRMAQGVEEIGTQMTTRFAEMGGQLQAGLADATAAMVEELKRATAEAGKQLAELLNPFTTAMRALHAVTGSLQAQALAQSALLDRQSGITREVNEALNAATAPLRSLASHTTTLNAAIQALERATARVAELEGALAEVSSGVSNGLADAALQLDRTVAGLGVFVPKMEAWMTSTAGSIEQFGATMSAAVHKTLQEYDSSLTSAVRGLGDAGHELIGAAEEFTQRVAQLRASN